VENLLLTFQQQSITLLLLAVVVVRVQMGVLEAAAAAVQVDSVPQRDFQYRQVLELPSRLEVLELEVLAL
jgi:hypothetical protein